MDEETFKELKKVLGLDQNSEQIHMATAYSFITQSSFDLANVVLYVKKYEVMTPEGRARFGSAVRTYLTDLQQILDAEAAIEMLRETD